MLRRPFLLAVLSGALFALAFIFAQLWPLACIAGLPLLAALHHAEKKHIFLMGFLCGLILHLAALYPIFWHTLPIDWFGISSPTLQILAVAFTWIITAIPLAAGTGFFALLAAPALRQRLAYVTIPLLWAACEWAGAVFFSTLFAGPGSLMGAHFSFGHIGYLLAHDGALAQISWIGGVYALSALTILIGFALYRFICVHQHGRHGIIVLLSGVVCIGGAHLIVSQIPPEESSITVAALRSSAPPMLYLTKEEEVWRADKLLAALATTPTSSAAVLLPEGATVGRFRDLSRESFPLIVDSENIGTTGANAYSEVAFHYEDGKIERSVKQFVLPIGEYIPYLYRIPLQLFPLGTFSQQALTTRAFVSGRETRFARADGIAIAVRFCDEVMSPFLYARDAAHGASILANISSYSWFHGSHMVFERMQTIARVRAIENRRPYVQSANMGAAFALDAYGRLVATTGDATYGAIAVSLKPHTERTPYQLLAPILPIFFAGVLLIRFWRVMHSKEENTHLI